MGYTGKLWLLCIDAPQVLKVSQFFRSWLSISGGTTLTKNGLVSLELHNIAGKTAQVKRLLWLVRLDA
jgi:hypothetical protein